MAKMAGISASGKVVDAGDQVSILGAVTAISGSGSKAMVTVQTTNGNGSFVAQAQDMAAPQSTGPAMDRNGKSFGVGSQVTVIGTATAVVGADRQAQLSVVLSGSQSTVTAPAVTSHAPHKR